MTFRRTTTDLINTKYLEAKTTNGKADFIYITHGTMTLAFTKENGALDEFVAEIRKVLEYIDVP